MAARTRRRHGCEGVPSLAQFPLDGGGVAEVAVFEARTALPGVRVLVHRPVLDDGRTSAWPCLALAAAPELTPLDAPPRVRFESDGSTLRAQVAFAQGTSFYGAGMVAAQLLRNGRSVELWNSDAWGYGEASPALYQSHPWVLAVLGDGRAVGVLAASVARGVIAIAADGLELAFEREPFDVLVIEAPSPQLATSALTELTGRIEMPPAWALGYHQCRWSYMSATEVRELAREFRARRIPCDALWLDIDYMDRFRVFTWDRERFAEPKALTDELRALELHTVAILDPGVAVDASYAACASGLAGEHFVTDEHGAPVRGRVWPGPCHFPDFTRVETRAWWSEHVERFVRASGLDGLWCDMNEPALFRTPTKTLPLGSRHRGLGGGPHARFHNLYGLLMASATRDGLLRAAPERKPFVLTRANHLAGARFAATWTGDNQATWDDLRWSIPMVLSLGLCGQPFVGPDIGGFDGDPDPELFARWFELGAYLPFARGHGEKSSCRKEPWSFGAEVERCVRAALERRMELLPTLHTLFHEAATTGLPVARPMFFADASDPALRDIDDQFLLGDALLVAPIVHAGETSREVVLPRGSDWYAFPSGGDRLAPGRIRVEAPLGRTPVFARAGSIVVTRPSALSSQASARLAPVLQVMLDSDGNARGHLYEDDGEHRARTAADARLTRMTARSENGRVRVLSESEGEFERVVRPWSVVVHGAH